MGKAPHVIILAGPNGAGKSTSAPVLLRDTFAVDEFVNADTIAQGLSAFRPESAALEAGRIMLNRLHELANKQVDFAFETTLASRTFAPWLKRLGEEGYKIHLMFLTLPNAEAAIARVASRVSLGGHNVPVDDIKRRFESGLKNLFQLYIPIVASWKIYDNSQPVHPIKFAEGSQGLVPKIIDITLYDKLIRRYGHAC
ncbi:zeta toxin family protein [Deltaproteobacteria bacterium OttesenSCG-928-K17]|nr:zeta toxin family protein [Deltaproteobacteria bacterium OttesenSCG-928-K17]